VVEQLGSGLNSYPQDFDADFVKSLRGCGIETASLLLPSIDPQAPVNVAEVVKTSSAGKIAEWRPQAVITIIQTARESYPLESMAAGRTKSVDFAVTVLDNASNQTIRKYHLHFTVGPGHVTKEDSLSYYNIADPAHENDTMPFVLLDKMYLDKIVGACKPVKATPAD